LGANAPTMQRLRTHPHLTKIVRQQQQRSAVAAMPFKSMRRIKRDPGVGDAQEEEEEEEEAAAEEDAQQQQQQQQHPSLRRRIDESGLSVPEMRSQILSLMAHAETQAAAFRGMEQAQVMGLELQQARAQVVELKASIRIRDAALQAKDSILQATIQSKDAALQASAVALHSKDAVIDALRSKDAVIEAKNALLQAKDAEIQRLQAELVRRGPELAVGGRARPAPAPARAAAAAAARAPAPAPLLSQQQQVRINRPLPSPPSPIKPHLLTPLPLRRRRVLTKRSVCWWQGNTQLQQRNCSVPSTWGICPRAQSRRGCSYMAEKALPRIGREALNW